MSTEQGLNGMQWRIHATLVTPEVETGGALELRSLSNTSKALSQ